MFLRSSPGLHIFSTAAPPILLAGILYTLKHTSPRFTLPVTRHVIARAEEVTSLAQEGFLANFGRYVADLIPYRRIRVHLSVDTVRTLTTTDSYLISESITVYHQQHAHIC